MDALPAAEDEEPEADRRAREEKEDTDLLFLNLRVARLPRIQRECIRAHYYRGQTYRAIAEERSISEQSVAKTMNKAMNCLLYTSDAADD